MSPMLQCRATQIFVSVAVVTSSSCVIFASVAGEIPVALSKSDFLIFLSMSKCHSLLYETILSSLPFDWSILYQNFIHLPIWQIQFSKVLSIILYSTHSLFHLPQAKQNAVRKWAFFELIDYKQAKLPNKNGVFLQVRKFSVFGLHTLSTIGTAPK